MIRPEALQTTGFQQLVFMCQPEYLTDSLNNMALDARLAVDSSSSSEVTEQGSGAEEEEDSEWSESEDHGEGGLDLDDEPALESS